MAAPPVMDALALHLQMVENDPATPLDVPLLEECELLTGTPEYRSSIWRVTGPLFVQLASILPTLQQDPTPLTRFIIKLAAPYRFDDVKHVYFEMALDLDAPPFHAMILTLLRKAAASSADAQALANRPAAMLALVRLYLCTKDTAIAEQTAELLVSLLKVSKNEPVPASRNAQLPHYGAAPMWKRLFNDRAIYTLYYQYTTLSALAVPSEPPLSTSNKTIAQARLLHLLPLVGAMDWDTVTSSHEPNIERDVGLAPGQGLLHYALLKMVETYEDLMMEMTWLDFCTALLKTGGTSSHLRRNDSNLHLDFLKEHGVHQNILSLYLSETNESNQDYTEVLIHGQRAAYVVEYVRQNPEDFESSAELQAIQQNARRTSFYPLIEAMHRSCLIPRIGGKLAWDDCVLLGLPFTTDGFALQTLAKVFRGPFQIEITFPSPSATAASTPASTRIATEKTYARLLAALFWSKRPNLFTTLISHAETLSLKDIALASLEVLQSLILANWSTDPLPNYPVDTDATYQRLQQFPATGLQVLLDPTIAGGVIPYLLKPATSFVGTVGGVGSSESPGWQVGMKKFEVLKALERKLKEEGGPHEVVSRVQRRVAQGPWGDTNADVGSRIATMDM